MSTELANISNEIMSSLILKGDISGLDSKQRVQYVMNLCQRIGLDPLTQPFKILKLQGKEVLYADKGCAQQLCKVYGISTEITKQEKVENLYVVTVRASGKDGKCTDDIGAVTIGDTKGDTLANALMKAVTKAKRRAVLAYCGLGMLDETEIETIKGAKTENIIDAATIEQEEEKKVKSQVALMRQAIGFIKGQVSEKDYAEVLLWHKVDNIDTLEDVALGQKIYNDLRGRIKPEVKK